jgi:hypothetical protein
VKAENVEPERCGEAIRRIGELYQIEKEIREGKLTGEAKQKVRGEKSRLLVAEFFEWLKQELIAGALLPKNPFTKAANYALKRKSALEVFLADPEVPMDTNHLERALRVIPMGRKNWLFCWTEIGAEKVGQIQSLIATCVLHDIDPYTYLIDILQRIDTHPHHRSRSGQGEASAATAERLRSGVSVRRAPGVPGRTGHGPYPRRSVSSADPGKDRALSPDDEERGQASALLLP